MKKLLPLCIVLLISCSSPCLAGSCEDSKNAANTAIKERNERVKDSHNVMMPDPEETRGPLSDCLGSISNIGDAFTLGISIPSMDQIVESMCRQVDSMIQDKMNDVLSELKSSIPDIGGNNPFQVSGSASSISSSVMNKIK